MGKGKPLFEILQEQKAERGRLNLTAPSRKAERAEPPGEPQPEPTAKAVPKAPPATEPQAPPVDPPQPAATGAGEADGPREDGAERSVDLQQAIQWLKEPVGYRVPRGALGAAAAAVALLLGVSFVAGQWLGERSVIEQQQQYHAASSTLTELQQQPRPGLLPSTTPSTAPSGVPTDVPEPHGSRLALGDGNDGDDPRIEGLNYFRLIVVPASAGEEIYRIVDFLNDHEVDAAVVPINNGRSLKVVALPGFDRPRSDPRALALRERLKVLGRKWRTEHRGSTDWSDLMAERYRPGVN